jgi:predicted amidophosphoribosyltransferase
MGELTKCLVCKKKISADAEKCPHCGSEEATKMGVFGMLLKGIGGIFVLYIIAKMYFGWETNFLYFF